ncbi:MAG TPA: hypothetical protein VGO91_13660 [Pyrinomonadaceae bacterium]|jgi:hypothetical protein|nr:hypothetical protein [Pyrinomonadaceae bacterium]
MQVCRYCAAPIDPETARTAADLQEKVNQACNDASYLKIAAGTMFVFLALSIIPFIGITYWGFLFIFLAVIVLFIRWQANFGKLQTSDPDYIKARRSKNMALILWLVAIPVGFIIRPIVAAIILQMMLR